MWIVLGQFFCSRAVLKEMAGPMYSAPGMLWFVAFDDDHDDAVGFVSLREKDGALWYDYAYVAPDMRGKGIFAKLSKARDKHLRGNRRPLRATMPKRRWKHYEERGWSIVSQRGSWITLEKAT